MRILCTITLSQSRRTSRDRQPVYIRIPSWVLYVGLPPYGAKSPDGHLRGLTPSHSPSPHCRMAQRNVQHCNRTAHSRSHWPAARYWAHTDHSSDRSHWEGMSIDQWLCHSGSQSHYSAPSRCPRNCRHTLKKNSMIKCTSDHIHSIQRLVPSKQLSLALSKSQC